MDLLTSNSFWNTAIKNIWKNIKYSQTKRNFFSRLFRFMLVYVFSTVTDWLWRKGFLKSFVTYATRILNCKKELFKTFFHIKTETTAHSWGCLMTKFIEKWSSWNCLGVFPRFQEVSFFTFLFVCLFFRTWRKTNSLQWTPPSKEHPRTCHKLTIVQQTMV